MSHPDRVWVLKSRPEGSDFAAALALEARPAAALAEGEVRLRNLWLSMDAGTRMWMGPRTDGYSPPTPLDTPISGLVVGEVLESRCAGFAVGDLVRGFGQWGDTSVLQPALGLADKLDPTVADVRQHMGVLGPNAWTAYVGMVETARAQPGETVLVSAAAGATGLLAAQVARTMGCKVVGVAGGADKCARLTDHYGLDAAIDRHAGDVGAQLEAAAPDGFHVYFDNVGGPLLDEVLPRMALHGRIAICGLVASYDRDAGAPGPSRFDQVLMRRLTIKGFFAPDFWARGAALNARMRPWLDTGRIRLDFDVTEGLERTPQAYARLFTGPKIGKALVRL